MPDKISTDSDYGSRPKQIRTLGNNSEDRSSSAILERGYASSRSYSGIALSGNPTAIYGNIIGFPEVQTLSEVQPNGQPAPYWNKDSRDAPARDLNILRPPAFSSHDANEIHELGALLRTTT